MKSKILKTSIVILLIMTLTMVNFITIGNSFVSYASEDISTNHKNAGLCALKRGEARGYNTGIGTGQVPGRKKKEEV